MLASFLIAYIPLTHMSHMFMKYFLYHNVKWDDAPNRPGSLIESAVEKNLEIQADLEGKTYRCGRRKILAGYRFFDA